jgi:hypothetical protein
MKRLHKNGFILAETLIVSVVLLISFVFVFTQFLTIFAQYQTFERYYNVDSLYAAKNVETFIREDNYDAVITKLNTNIASSIPYYEFTTCPTDVLVFPVLCTKLIQDLGITKALFTTHDMANLKNYNTYSNNFSHELKQYITFLSKQGFSNLPSSYRVILQMSDGTFSTFSTVTRADLTSKPQYRYKAGYISLDGSANSTVLISKTIPASLTIEMWASTNVIGEKAMFSFANSSYTFGPVFGIFGGNYAIRTSGGTYNFSGAYPLPTIHSWHHYAVTFNGSNSTCYLYIDGRYIGSATYQNPSGSSLYIGRISNSTTNNWNGNIREFKIWGRVLTPIEISDSVNNLNVSSTNLSYYYKLTEGSGTTLIDYSGNNQSIDNALANVSWNKDANFSDWHDGTVSKGVYPNIETRYLYFYNGKWLTETDLGFNL